MRCDSTRPSYSGPAREPEVSSDSSSADRVLSGFVTAQVVEKLRDWVWAQSTVDILRDVEGVLYYYHYYYYCIIIIMTINDYTSNILIMKYKKTLVERMKKSPYGNTRPYNGVSALLLRCQVSEVEEVAVNPRVLYSSTWGDEVNVVLLLFVIIIHISRWVRSKSRWWGGD